MIDRTEEIGVWARVLNLNAVCVNNFKAVVCLTGNSIVRRANNTADDDDLVELSFLCGLN